ncbi:aminoglycoside adenylyltransferase domain-containing protein [Deinococcus sp.]|uniref:aminoglycoside adenylyltransferase domain-containing protein n=1 Tax=Deinococcus sp. TaxID=47478 RepID=UPI003CC524B6
MIVHDEVKALVSRLLHRQQEGLGPNFLGLYLRGSLALGAFDPETSDVDALCVTETVLDAAEEAALKRLHLELAALPNSYATELELAYLPRASAWRWRAGESHLTLGRGSGELQWSEHRENWVLERWAVREHGLTLAGPPPISLIAPVSHEHLRRAVTARLHDWHAFALTPNDPGWGHRGHAAYATETVCRMLHTLHTGQLASKADAVAWALSTLPDPWHELVAQAHRWKTDATLDAALNRTVQAFIGWAVRKAESSQR